MKKLWAFLGIIGYFVLLPFFHLSAYPEAFLLKGSIKDPKGKALSGVTVKATLVDSPAHQEVITDSSGAYVFANLPPGKYRLEAKGANFETAVKETNFEGHSTRIDFILKPSVPRPLNSATSKDQAKNTPRQRGFQSLRLQTPENMDASQDSVAANGIQRPSETPGSGVDNRATETLLIQGTISPGNQNNPFGRELSEDRMQEIRDRLRDQFGRGESGGRGAGSPTGFPTGGSGGGGFGGGFPGIGSGGGPGFGGPGGSGGPGGRVGGLGAGRIRGSLFENLHNSVFDARQFSFSGLEQTKEPYSQNNFGAFIGGPLSIPKIYQGKDRSSFFVGYVGSRNRSPFDTTVTVPTLAERNGDFSQTVGHTGGTIQPITIYDPAIPSGPAAARQFPNNIIPSSRLSPIARGLLDFFPLPNLPGSVLNYRLLQTLSSDSDMLTTRFNHRLSRKDNLSFNYSFQRRGSETGQSFPNFLTEQASRGQNFGMSLTHNFTQRLINNTNFRFNRMRTNTSNQFAFTRDIEGQLGINGVSRDPLNYGVPTLRFTNYAGLQDTYPLLRRDQTSHLGDTITYVKGVHTLRSGFEYRRIQLNNRSDPNGRGAFVFSGFTTAAFDQNGNAIPGSGYDLADFLLGLPQSTSVRYGSNNTYFRGQVFNSFFQDNWKVSSSLTLNLGIRYEYTTPLTEEQDHIANLDVAPGFAGVSVVLPGSNGPYSGLFPRALIDPDRNNLAPRIGIAWKPFGQRNLIIRSGYGIFYNASIYNRLYTQLASQPPFAISNNLITRPDRVLTLSDGFLNDPQFTVSNSYAVDRNLRVGYVQQWNLDVQQGLSTFDIRHQLNLNAGYEFPFGQRKRFFSNGGVPARILGGWSLSGNATLQSGSPYTARILGSSINNSGTDANQSERADATGTVPKPEKFGVLKTLKA